jgi:Arc/MetJ family transcription regulator
VAIRKTALLLDEELVARAKEILGTTTTTDTLAEALREVIRVQGRARHFERLRKRAADLNDPQLMGELWAKGARRFDTYGDGCGDASS